MQTSSAAWKYSSKLQICQSTALTDLSHVNNVTVSSVMRRYLGVITDVTAIVAAVVNNVTVAIHLVSLSFY